MTTPKQITRTVILPLMCGYIKDYPNVMITDITLLQYLQSKGKDVSTDDIAYSIKRGYERNSRSLFNIQPAGPSSWKYVAEGDEPNGKPKPSKPYVSQKSDNDGDDTSFCLLGTIVTAKNGKWIVQCTDGSGYAVKRIWKGNG